MKIKKTITTFLLSDDPNGIKKVWVDGKIGNVIYLTRNDLEEAKNREELNQPSLYFLFGGDKKVYIGETENFNQRIKDHNKNKDFWNEVLVFTAKDDFLSKTEVQYLECLSIKQAKDLNNYQLEENKQTPNFPALAENKIEIVKQFFEEVTFLCSFLNYSIFEDYSKNHETKDYWFCRGKGINAKAVFNGEKFIVLAGSTICKNEVKSLQDNIRNKRKYIISNIDKVIERDSCYELKVNLEFTAVSFASAFCLGYPDRGWTTWKNKDGKTLDDILRK